MRLSTFLAATCAITTSLAAPLTVPTYHQASTKSPAGFKDQLQDAKDFLVPMATVLGIQIMSGCAKTDPKDLCGGPGSWAQAFGDWFNPPVNEKPVRMVINRIAKAMAASAVEKATGSE